MNKELFLKRLVSARENKNLSQTEVNQKLGINNKTLSSYERGNSEPDLQTLLQLARFYNVSVDWLLGSDFAVNGLFGQQLEAADRLINAQNKKIEALEAMIKALSVYKELCDKFNKILD